MFLFFFMKKVSYLFLASAIMATANYNALSHDFSDKVYGKANVSIGYQFQAIGNSAIKDRIKQAEEFGNTMNYNYHTLTFGVGYDFYFKVLDFIHPFVGLDIESRIPVKNSVFIKQPDGKEWPSTYWKLTDFMSFDLKFGSKFIINKDNAIQLYGLFGMNLLMSSTAGYDRSKPAGGINTSEPYVGLNVGGGLGYIYNINSSISVFGAVEYKYSYAKNVRDEEGLARGLYGDKEYGLFKNYAMHQVGVKFGVQF